MDADKLHGVDLPTPPQPSRLAASPLIEINLADLDLQFSSFLARS
jgi:hypothetical protein